MGTITHGLYLSRPRTCDGCGQRFVVDRTRNPAARYCSDACRREYGRYGNPANARRQPGEGR